MKGICEYCQVEGELIERADGKLFHPTHNCCLETGFDSKKYWKEGFCYRCGFKENDVPLPYHDIFITKRDGTTWHSRCAV